jgi:tRNA A-37 threonylcarbamoyl transferase component Bud32
MQAAEVAGALAYLHSRGVLHGDLTGAPLHVGGAVWCGLVLVGGCGC